MISLPIGLKAWYNRVKNRLGIMLRKADYGPKVFCIGFNKTGSTSVGKSFEMLGYRNSTFNQHVWRNYYQKGKIGKVLRYTSKFESLDDLPWLKEDMIPVLDKKFPGSKWVYLEREEEDWKNSIYNWTYKRTGQHPDMTQTVEEFRRHREFVLDYFKDRPQEEFIILNVKDPKGFQKLAAFLGKKTDQDAFPHFNKTSDFRSKF